MSEQKNKFRFQNSRSTWMMLALTFIGAFSVVYFYNSVPDYTDSYYHINGAESLVSGNGFVDQYLWTYIGAPDSLPAPSHLYWMPGTSVISAFGMLIFGQSYNAAIFGHALCLWFALMLAYWLGWHWGGSSRHAWMAVIATLFSGFFTRVWGQTDTFAPYALFGGASLVFMSLGISSEKNNLRYWVLAGIFAGLGHLVRSDGLILVLVGWSTLVWFFNRERYLQRLLWVIPFTLAYVLVMSPWFLRNYNELGRILPVGGTQNAYFTEYNDLFNYPPDAILDDLLANGGEALIETRTRAIFSSNSITLQVFAYQGAIIFFPFILVGLWHRRREPYMRPIWIFAVGIHLAFAFVFPEAGMRGSFWHATAALVPIWAVVGILGVDDTVEWISQFRRTWNPKLAKPFLSTGLMIMLVVLTVYVSVRSLEDDDTVALSLQEIIEPDARVMLNDPAKLYYYTGIIGVQIPNETPDVALELANVYDIDYLLLEEGFLTDPLKFDEAPDFLIPIEFDIEGATLYAIVRD